ncbi:hypothetical protein OROHE_016330 [Orobanche hederae]
MEKEEGRRRNPMKDMVGIDMYVRIELHEGGNRWYAIKSLSSCSSSSSMGRRSKIIDEALPPIPQHIERPAFASLGSIIYASGGRDCSPHVVDALPSVTSNKVFYLDTRCPGGGWKAAPPMIHNRLYHTMVADSDRNMICVFGGLKSRRPPDTPDGKHLYAEVYNLNSSVWEPLAYVGQELFDKLPQRGDGYGILHHKIIFHSYFNDDLFYIHTLITDDVGVFDPTLGKYLPPSVLLDGILYFISSRGRIFAYDLSTFNGIKKRVFLRNIKDNTLPATVYHFDEDDKPFRYLLSLGNNCLALIWAKKSFDEALTNVHCSVIEIKRLEGDRFEGNVLNCSTYSVPLGFLEGCMIVRSSKYQSPVSGGGALLEENPQPSKDKSIWVKSSKQKKGHHHHHYHSSSSDDDDDVSDVEKRRLKGRKRDHHRSRSRDDHRRSRYHSNGTKRL